MYISRSHNQDTSIHLLQTYVLPVIVYGLEVLLHRKVLQGKLNRTHKKFLKVIPKLLENVADPAVYVLPGTVPIECVIHKRALTLYGNICRLSEDAVEKQQARRQLFVKGYRGSSWFVEIRKLLHKYGLPPAWDDPPSKFRWKRLLSRQVDTYWSEQIKRRTVLYSSLKYLLYGEKASMYIASFRNERCSTS